MWKKENREKWNEYFLIEVFVSISLWILTCFSVQDPDDTLKRKTFDLLYKMTKSSNVEVIVDRMIDYMISINDHHYKTEIASRCVELAEQFAPSNQWFIQVKDQFIMFLCFSWWLCIYICKFTNFLFLLLCLFLSDHE